MKVYIIALTVLFALLAGTEAKGKTNAPISVPCPCVPKKGDCGKGFRVGVCEKATTKIKCKVPCNWKKEFGADCRYKFGSWGECDATSGTKPRTGTLKKALYKAECQRTVYVSKPCKPETKPTPETTSSQPGETVTPSSQPGEDVTSQSVSSSQPGEDVTSQSVSSSQPGEDVTPSSQPGETVTPSSQPGEDVTPSSQPGETVTPSSQPGEDVTPSSQTGETVTSQSVSSSQPGEDVTPSSQPGETVTPSSQPGETVTPSSQTGEDVTSQSVSSSQPGEDVTSQSVSSSQPGGDVTVTEADKAYIVNRHNELRRGVKPTASNMLKMSWSVVAAANAQRWADKCTLDHSPRRLRKLSRDIGCGENIAVGHSHTESSWADTIRMWHDEVKDWKYGMGSVNGETVGHFTQVVWYRSNQIGCAVAHCPNAKYKYRYFYVCQYCTPGNYQYTHPYKAGPACGDCPNDCDDKLCTNPCPYQDKWNNCADQGKWVCKGEKCEASCKCTNDEII